jgi:hypothetical protein
MPNITPVWRCERCNYWVPRLTDEAPECPYCSYPMYAEYRPVYMHEAYRIPPDPKGIQ